MPVLTNTISNLTSTVVVTVDELGASRDATNNGSLSNIAIQLGVEKSKVHYWNTGSTSLSTDYYVVSSTGKIYTGYAGTMSSAPDGDYTEVSTSNGYGVKSYKFESVAKMVACPVLKIGDLVEWVSYYEGNGYGGNSGTVVATGTGTADGGNYFQCTGTSYQIKSDMKSTHLLSEFGSGQTQLGYNPSIEQLVFNNTDDSDILVKGGIYPTKKFRGIRRNGLPLGVKGGVSSTTSDSGWNEQVVGVSTAQDLSSYGSNDGVTAYFDATLPALETWESAASVLSYTATTVTVDPSTYATMLRNIRIGDVIQTLHSPVYWGIVSSFDSTTGVITCSLGWAASGVLGTPSGTTGFTLNGINKAWTLNANIIVKSASYGTAAVIGELGAQINKSGVAVNGLDIVLLPGSTSDGTAAYLVRSGVSTKTWTYGYNAQGTRLNFNSASGDIQPYAGFNERSNAVCGMRFYKNNTYSMLWSTSSDQTATSMATSPTIIGPTGAVYRQPNRVQVISASTSLNELYPNYLISVAGVTLTLPPIANHVSGHAYVIYNLFSGNLYITAYNSETTVSGSTTFTLAVSTRTKYTIIFDGTQWQTYTG